MQFKKAQRSQLQKHWHGGSWFYKSLGPPARAIIECAYGLKECTPKLRAVAQDDVTTALTIFARRVGCEKSHIVHALLTGSIKHLKKALHSLQGNTDENYLRNAWEAAFRDINVGTLYVEDTDETEA